MPLRDRLERRGTRKVAARQGRGNAAASLRFLGDDGERPAGAPGDEPAGEEMEIGAGGGQHDFGPFALDAQQAQQLGADAVGLGGVDGLGRIAVQRQDQTVPQALGLGEGFRGYGRGGGGAEGDQGVVWPRAASVTVGAAGAAQMDPGVAAQTEKLGGRREFGLALASRLHEPDDRSARAGRHRNHRPSPLTARRGP